MSKYKTGKELIQELGIQGFELLEHVKAGLRPYDQFGRPLPPPNISAELNKNKRRAEELRQELNRMHWPDLPSSPKDVLKLCEINPAAGFGAILTRERLAPRRKSLLNEIEIIEKELKCLENKHSWAAYELPDDQKSAQWVIDLLQQSFFERENDKQNHSELNEINSTESVSDYIKRRREKGVNDNIIAVELLDKTGNFKLTLLDTARALGLDENLQPNQIDAMKHRAMSARKKGKALLQKQ